MSCGCSVGYEDGAEHCDIWDESRVNMSRKDHRCCECGSVIPKGSRYCRASALVNGQWSRWSRCLTCSTLAELIATIEGACPLWGGLWESADYVLSFDEYAKWRALAEGGGAE